MTGKCSSPVQWGDFGSELGYWQWQVAREGGQVDPKDDINKLKAKWQGKLYPKAKYRMPDNCSPSLTGVGLPKGTPYQFNYQTGEFRKAGYGGVYRLNK